MVQNPDLSAAPTAMVLQPARHVVASLLLYGTKVQWTGQTHICIKGKEKPDNISFSVKPVVFYFLLDYLSLSLSLFCVFNHFGEVLLFYSSLSLFCIAAVNVNSVVFFLGFKMFYSFSGAL